MDNQAFWNDQNGQGLSYDESLKLLQAGWHLTATSDSKSREMRFNLHLSLTEAEKTPFEKRLNYSIPFQLGDKLACTTNMRLKDFSCNTYNGRTFVTHTYAYGQPTLEDIKLELGVMLRSMSYLNKAHLRIDAD